MKLKTRTLTAVLCAFVIFFAEAAAQTPTTTAVTQLTTEQTAMLTEASALSRRVIELNNGRKHDEAMPLAERTIRLRKTALGENNVLVADAISNLAGLYVGKQDYERAEIEFRKALAIYESVGGVPNNMGYVLNSLALLCWATRDYGKAEAYAKRAIDLNEKLHGEQSAQFLESLNILIKISISADKTNQRNAALSRSLSVFEKHKDKMDRPSLFRYRCILSEGKQNPEASALKNRIEVLLDWHDPTPAPSSVGVLNGRAVTLMKPEYPREARAARVSGTVVVEIEIDECGNVSKVRMLSGPSMLWSACERAAKLSRFSPTFVNGFPIRVVGELRFNFVKL
ncbi:MAG TPA: TonB family protein [Pyrinomonadaceae bacterium]|nr:TonB family protein [Pyrinomonadaceae bacterium]